MRTRTAAAIVALSAIFVGTIEAPAATAKYADVNGWTVIGESTTGSCVTLRMFSDGSALAIGINSNASINVGYANPRINPSINTPYTLTITTNLKARAVLVGSGVKNGIDVRNVSPRVLDALAVSKWADFDGIGRLDMSGSKAAIIKTIECVKALAGKEI